MKGGCLVLGFVLVVNNNRLLLGICANYHLGGTKQPIGGSWLLVLCFNTMRIKVLLGASFLHHLSMFHRCSVCQLHCFQLYPPHMCTSFPRITLLITHLPTTNEHRLLVPMPNPQIQHEHSLPLAHCLLPACFPSAPISPR